MAFSTNGTSGGDGLSSEINITPLIDVLLVMLIIFMVIVPGMPRGLESALASGASAGPAEEASDSPVLVQVNADQTAVRYIVDGVSTNSTGVAARLLELLS